MSPLVALFVELGAWNWWILAAVLLMLELTAPGMFFIWLAVAGALVGGLSLMVDVPWQWQLVLFGVLSLVSAMAYLGWSKRNPSPSDAPLLNRRAHKLIGRSFSLSEPLAHGRGRVRVGDGYWLVEGPDMAKGTRVKVVGADGTVLQVEPAGEA